MELEQKIYNFAHEYLHYDPKSGQLSWSKRPSRSSVSVGDEVGSLDKDGYRRFTIMGKQYIGARIVWLMFNKKFPSGQIDHINNDRLDNRIENLRDVTPQQNSFNRRRKVCNSSGYKGVTFHKRDKKWQATIEYNGKTRFLGYFSKPEDAHKAYCNAAEKAYGEYCNFG